MGTAISIISQGNNDDIALFEQLLAYWGYSSRVYSSWEEATLEEIVIALKPLPDESKSIIPEGANTTFLLLEPKDNPEALFAIPEKRRLLDSDFYVFQSQLGCIAYLVTLGSTTITEEPKKAYFYLIYALIQQLQSLQQKVKRLQSAFKLNDEAAIFKAVDGVSLPPHIKDKLTAAILERVDQEIPINVSFDQIIHAYQQALAIDPDRTELLLKWSEELIKQDQYTEGKEIQAQLDFKLKIKTSKYGAQIDRGVYYNNQKNYRKAKDLLHKVVESLEADQNRHSHPYSKYFTPSLSRACHVLGIVYLEQLYENQEVNRKRREYGKAHQVLTQAFKLRQQVLQSSTQSSEAENTACQEFVSSANALATLHQEADETRFPALKDTSKAIEYITQALESIEKLSKPSKDIYVLHLETIKKLKSILEDSDERVEKLKYTERKLNRLIENSSDISVFISFSSKDWEVKEKVKDFLVQSGISVTDYDNSMQLGEEIEDFISRAIEENSFTINLISKNSLVSAWVANELLKNSAYKNLKGKKYIPCLIDEIIFDDNFVSDARDKVDTEMQRLRAQMIEQLEQEEPIDHLFSQYKLKEQLHVNIASLIDKLTRIGCPRLTPEFFEEKIDKLANKIIEEGNSLVN